MVAASYGTLSRERYLALIEAGVAQFAEHLATGDLLAPVAACRGWDVGDLGAHLGGVHRWATQALTATAPPEVPEAPGREELAAWFVEGGALLLRSLGAVDPDQECWGFGPRPRTASFWVRRQALETAVHAWDAADALGRPTTLPADLAADGVDEVASVLYPRQVRLGRRPPVDAPVLLVASDADLASAGSLIGEGEPVGTVVGPAAALLLLVWGRRDLDVLVAEGAARVEGDEARLRAALALPLTP